MSSSKPLPTLAELLDMRLDVAMANMNCVSLGTIQSFDVADQTATIKVNYKKIFRDVNPAQNNIQSTDQIVEYPILVKCPVVVLNGGGAFLSFPISAGDTCLLLFCDREMDTWFRTGVTTYPQSERMHNLTDAVAIVGIRSSANPIPAVDDEKSVWSFLNGMLSAVDRTSERLNQSGDVKATARSSAPPGWLLCYGQAISRTTYADLFAAIGTTYGAGDGSTTFNVPDLRGRTIVGLDNMGGSQAGRLTTTYTPNRNTLGGGVGEEAHQLTIPELPSHTHTPNIESKSVFTSSGGSGWNLSDDSTSNGGANQLVNTNTGSDTPHNTVQPGLMLNYIIKI